MLSNDHDIKIKYDRILLQSGRIDAILLAAIIDEIGGNENRSVHGRKRMGMSMMSVVKMRMMFSNPRIEEPLIVGWSATDASAASAASGDGRGHRRRLCGWTQRRPTFETIPQTPRPRSALVVVVVVVVDVAVHVVVVADTRTCRLSLHFVHFRLTQLWFWMMFNFCHSVQRSTCNSSMQIY